MLGILALILTIGSAAWGFWQARDFVRRKLRFVESAQTPYAPILAGATAGLIAWILPFVGLGAAALFGLGVGAGVASGAKDIRRSLPPG